MQLTAQNLTGRFVRLEPIQESHREELRMAANDPAIWAFTTFDGSGAGFDPWFNWACKVGQSGAHVVFCVRRLSDNTFVGSTQFAGIVPEHKRTELGYTWYTIDAQGGPVNPDCKLLLLAHAFAAGANRVELKTDTRNARSRAAITKLGAKQEGIFRAHMVVRDGHIRDTVYFSIIRSEWADVRARLEARLAQF